MMESVTIQDEEEPEESIQLKVEIQGTHESDVAALDQEESRTKKKCCGWLEFHGCGEARGFAFLGTARGAVVMSNIFISTSFIYLASEEAGCLNEKDEVIEDCVNKVYGFQPPSLVAIVAVVSGLLSAILMPLIGAIIDFTPHRRLTGIVAAAFLVVIQAAQIFTVQATWFPMLILQAVAGFIYQVEVLTPYAYLPEIARSVGEKLMTRFTSMFVMMQFSAQALFLVLVIAIAFPFGLNDVHTAQLSQGINVVWISIGFFFGWKILPDVPSRHERHKGHSLWMEGFKQVWKTSKSINRNYPHGLRWFFLGTIFGDAGANAFTVVSVVYLSDHLQMSGTQIGLIFIITLVGSVPGSKLGSKITKRTNPNTSLKINLVVFSIVTFAGAFALSGPDQSYLAYVWGVMWGFILGWFYSTENLFFSMVLPKGQETELTGFFIYCTQILTWLPPLVFTLMIESGINQRWGLMSLIIFFVIAIGLFSLVAPWEDVLKESAKMIDADKIMDDVVEVTDVTEDATEDVTEEP